jgi:hypothetical protein
MVQPLEDGAFDRRRAYARRVLRVVHCGAPRAHALRACFRASVPPDYLPLRSALADCFIRLIGVAPKLPRRLADVDRNSEAPQHQVRNVCFSAAMGRKGTFAPTSIALIPA